jgi:hypothetical protein
MLCGLEAYILDHSAFDQGQSAPHDPPDITAISAVVAKGAIVGASVAAANCGQTKHAGLVLHPL